MFNLIDRVCCLCLLTDSTQLHTISEDEEDNLISKIHFTLKCKIVNSDKLSKFVCRECLFTIDFISAYNMWFTEVADQATNVQQLLELCLTDESAKFSIDSKIKERNCLRSHKPLEPPPVYTWFYTSLMDSIFLRMKNYQSDSHERLNCLADKHNTNNLDTIGASPISEFEQNLEKSSINEDDKSCDNPFNENDNLEENFTCEENLICEDTFPIQNLLHSRGSEELTCPECEKVFQKKPLLMRHLLSHQGAVEKYQCQICRRKFISTSEVQRHTRAHMGLKPYKCKLCFRFFSQKNLLDNHMDWHQGRKGHLCDICGKSFSSGPNLKMHKDNLHSLIKMKPFSCKECGKSFSRKHHLENHFTTHVSARPFQCTTCGLTFKRSSQLQEHEIVHTGKKQYDCTVCKKSFRTKRVLNVHKLLHTGLKEYQCTICTQSFVRKGGLTVHMKTHSKYNDHS